MPPIISHMHGWWSAITALLTAFLLLYGGAVAVRKSYCWILELYDRKVSDLLLTRRLLHGYVGGELREPPIIELPYTVKEIAAALSRKDTRVLKSLERLRRHGNAEPYRNGWRSPNSPYQPY